MITFFSLIEGGYAPRKASRSANGTLPTSGYRYCEPIRTASSFGWYVYPPFDFWLMWDGAEIVWTISDGDDWYPLANGVQFPGFENRFRNFAPEDVSEHAPPFLAHGTDHDSLAIWTGQMAKTEPGYGVILRAPVNLAWRTDFTAFEGVIETDRWFGPLFTNIRLRKRDAPIIFRKTEPFLQVQPISLTHLRDVFKTEAGQKQGLESLDEEDWENFRQTVVRRMKTRSKLGEYAVETRKRKL